MEVWKRERRGAGMLLLGMALALAGPCRAEVKEYQIRRMLMLKTECQVTGLDISVKEGRDRFLASCENVSHYPDGVEILCPDTDDERECHIVTAKRDFRHLHLLRP